MNNIKQKYLNDMEIRGFAQNTIRGYFSSVEKFIDYHTKSPLDISIDEINDYQLYLKNEKKYSWSSFNINVCAIRFLYKITLKQKELIEHIPFGKRDRALPIVLSKEEVIHTYNSLLDLRKKAIFITLYACGLRVSELVNLKISDIDSKRMLILIKDSKGGKDRYVVLSQKHLLLLRKYYIAEKIKPSLYLFPGKYHDKPMTPRPLQSMFSRIRINSTLNKKITPHTLRHSYATHMLEDGVDIRKIQMLLGHNSLRTTAGYLHIVNNFYSKVTSPIDGMNIK